MRIAFYAPMKPPDSPVPSGERAMARRLIAALQAAGHDIRLASRLRSRDGAGNAASQARIRARGEATARRLVARWRSAPAERPELWFTYHLYHKAPDWLGPPVTEALGIPYVIAEASYAPKQQRGPWADGHRAAAAAIRRAAAVIAFNARDMACVAPLLTMPERLHFMPPFLETEPFARAAEARAAHRAALGVDPAVPVLLAVAMMRPGDKLASFRALGAALRQVCDLPWRLVVAGDGPARAEVEAALAPLGAERLVLRGAVAPPALPALYGGADLLVWPAIREAYGMALLEAQAAGLPVVAGRAGGVAGIVRDGETGLLPPEGDVAAFAAAVRALLGDPARRRAMAHRAREAVASQHGMAAAAARLDAILSGVRAQAA